MELKESLMLLIRINIFVICFRHILWSLRENAPQTSFIRLREAEQTCSQRDRAPGAYFRNNSSTNYRCGKFSNWQTSSFKEIPPTPLFSWSIDLWNWLKFWTVVWGYESECFVRKFKASTSSNISKIWSTVILWIPWKFQWDLSWSC